MLPRAVELVSGGGGGGGRSVLDTALYKIIIILFIERHIQQAVRGALQHTNIQVNYF